VIDSVAPPSSSEGADQPIPELRRLGERLAQARAQTGMAAEDLANRLRISPGQLQALEEGDHTRLPEGVFVLALARRVAGVLHVNVDEAVLAARQSRLMGRSHPISSPPKQPPQPTVNADRDPPRSAQPAEAPSPPPAQPMAPQDSAPPPDPSPSLAPTPSPPATASLAPSPARLPWRWLLGALVASAGLAGAWLWSSSPSPRMAPTSSTPPAAPTLAPSPAEPPGPAGQDSLRLTVSEPSWVEVRAVDGQTVYEGTLTGEKRFPIGRGLEVLAGRPHAVRAAIGAGPGTPLGGVSDIRWKRFSPPSPPPGGPPSPSPSR
jgi:cytoskeletal protein RodZ